MKSTCPKCGHVQPDIESLHYAFCQACNERYTKKLSEGVARLTERLAVNVVNDQCKVGDLMLVLKENLVHHALLETKGNVRKASILLGVGDQAIYRWIDVKVWRKRFIDKIRK